MPELSNIQTFEKIDGSNFRPTLERFSNVLRSIGLWNNEIKKEFNNFEWKVEDDGFVDSSINELGYFTSKLSDVKIRPLVLGYTSVIDQTFKENWICCEFLIETEELLNFKNGQFYDFTYNLIKAIAYEMQREFKQTGIYFTDEAQDGSDFDGIRSSKIDKLWKFDYAIIPFALEKIYLKKPITHDIKRQENCIEAWYKDRWKES